MKSFFFLTQAPATRISGTASLLPGLGDAPRQLTWRVNGPVPPTTAQERWMDVSV